MEVPVSTGMTLAEYLEYDDGTENRYELVDGELVVMPPEHIGNQDIASVLFACFLKKGFPPHLLNIGAEVATIGSRATTRLPDFLVMGEELKAALKLTQRSTITPDMPPPELVVEVVSPGKENRERDYRYKRSEYAARRIEEYWIVDPQVQQVTILGLVSGLYEGRVYTGGQSLISPKFGRLGLTAEQLLDGELPQTTD